MKSTVYAVLFAVSAWLASTAAYAGANQVAIKNFAFVPATLTITAGTTVTWTNTDEDPHTVADRGDAHLFRSAALDTNDKFSYTFTTPGSYAYFCTLHPHMVGKIIVTASTGGGQK